MKATLSDKTYLTDLDGFQMMGIEKALTYSNPKYQEALKQGRSVRGIDKHIQLFEHTGNGLSIPRGVSLVSLGMMAETTRDEMHSHPVMIKTMIEPRNYQERALKLAVHAGGGVIVAPTGAGKTTMGIELASRLGERCLILVKSKDLAAQWIGAIKKFTGLDFGIIGGGKWLEGEQFTVATVQTLIKHEGSLDYGLVIVDECHNVPAMQAYTVINCQRAKYRFGLSATPQRRDGLEMMIHAALGPIVAEIKPSEVEGAVLPVKVEMIEIDYPWPAPDSWNGFIESLVDDEERNQAIIKLIASAQASRPGSVIVLSQQVKHCEILYQMALDAGKECLLIHGQLPTAERTTRIKQAQTTRLIFGTSQLLSEGIDIPPLETLIFASPMSAVIEK